MNSNAPKDDTRSSAKRPSSGKAAADKTPPLDDTEVGSVLRSVYQQTINEDIPAEMLDLLKKLT